MRLLFALLLCACSNAPAYPPQLLSQWNLFTDGRHQLPAQGVVPYELISPLFSDYASKHRFIRLPVGTQIDYSDSGVWHFPTGTALIKTFGFLADDRDPSSAERLIETRLLVLESDGGWHPYVYLWNDAMTDAELHLQGEQVPVDLIEPNGTMRSIGYHVPDTFQCANCHGGAAPASPIGPRTEQFDRLHDFGSGPENQIDHFASLGMFSGSVTPAASRTHLVDPFDTSAPIDARGRAYLDANCAHCHRDGGAAQQTGLWLQASVMEGPTTGFCKRPIAAGAGTGGRSYDVVPGMPDQSVMTFRMASEVPGIKMPELPNVISHSEGVALITEWITSLSPAGCM